MWALSGNSWKRKTKYPVEDLCATHFRVIYIYIYIYIKCMIEMTKPLYILSKNHSVFLCLNSWISLKILESTKITGKLACFGTKSLIIGTPSYIFSFGAQIFILLYNLCCLTMSKAFTYKSALISRQLGNESAI